MISTTVCGPSCSRGAPN